MTGLPFVWDDLRYFLAVARTGQLSRAARQIKTSHVTVGRRLERLELALQSRLFERSPRGYHLTPAGERLLAMAERLEQETERLQEQVQASPTVHRGVIRLNMPEGFCWFFCNQILGDFSARFPALSLELVSIQQILSLSRKVSDLAIVLEQPKAGPYWAEKLSDYTLQLYATREYLAGAPPIRQREDLLDHPFVGYIDELIFAPGLDYLGEVHPGLKPRFQFSSILMQLTTVRGGHGVTVLPNFLGARFPELVEVLPEVRLTRRYWLTCHRDLLGAPRERAVIDFLREALRLRQHRLVPGGPSD